MAEPTDGNTIVVEILASVAGLIEGMGEATNVIAESTATMEASMEGLGAASSAALAPLLGLFVLLQGAKVFEETITGVMELAVNLDIMHQKTGMAVEDLSRLAYAADLSHVSSEQLSIGLQRLARSMATAAQGGISPTADAFKELGIQAFTSSGQLTPMNQVLIEVAERVKTMPDGATKTALAMDLFGRSGAALIPLLNRGKDGIAELEKESDRLGRTMSESDVTAGLEFEEAMKRLQATFGGLVKDLVTAVEPALTFVFEVLASLVHVAEAVGRAFLALGAAMSFQAQYAKDNWKQALADLKAAQDDFVQRTPAQATDEPGAAPPIINHDAISEMEKFQLELDKLKSASASDFGDLNTLELNFWLQKLQIVDKNSKEYVAIYGKVTDLQMQIAKAQYDAGLAQLDAQESLDKANLVQVVADREEELAYIRKHYGELSKEVQDGIKRVNEAQAAVLKANEEQWKATFDAIPAMFQNTVNSMKQTGGTFGDFMKQLLGGLVLDFASSEAKIAEAHAAMWLAKKGLSAQGFAEEIAMSAWAALAWIGNEAAKAAASAWAALEGVPFIGPVLGPAAAAAALAGVLALGGSIKSAAGGYDIPSGLNPVTQLHQNEMVLPAKYADVIRGLAGSGGSGSGVTLNVYALDGPSVASWAQRNQTAIGKAALAYADNGGNSNRTPGRRS